MCSVHGSQSENNDANKELSEPSFEVKTTIKRGKMHAVLPLRQNSKRIYLQNLFKGRQIQ